MFAGPLFQIKLDLRSTVLLIGFQKHRVWHYQVNLTGLEGIINELFTRPSQFSQASGMTNFNTAIALLCFVAVMLLSLWWTQMFYLPPPHIASKW